LQTSPGKEGAQGSLHVIDLDLSRYDQIAARFEQTSQEGISYLKQGIDTKNKAFNALIAMLERVAIRSPAPILLTGKTGVGKSRLAKLLYELKKQRGMVQGKFVEVNCATLRGDNAMSALFGHTKGAFTGAMSSRAGLLKEAHNGLLFLDEIGELGLDEQAMLLSAIEDKTFMAMGSDQQTSSDFQLIAGTNRDLFEQVRQGRFREDLLARINLWTVELPSLRERLDDLEPNIQHEIQLFSHKAGRKVSFNQGAKERYLAFAYSPQAMWQANFRDLSASMTRMATLAEGGRITEQVVDDEIERLTTQWQKSVIAHDQQVIRLEKYLSQEAIAMIDQFDQLQLQSVIAVCQASSSMADAGRKLFHVSRQARSSQNDSHRLKTYLNKFGLSFGEVTHRSLSDNA
jgi:transcriptional regulatory protein RtcR